MKNGKLLTIAICAYNMEAFLGRALESCVMPDLSKVEVLIMNDGSTDRTGEISDEYAAKYPDVFFHIRKANGGWGSNLNMAVRIAKGKYFKELDADDWFETSNMHRLLDTLESTDVDMVITNHRYCYCDHTRDNIPQWHNFLGKTEKLENIPPFYFPIWDAAYRTDILKAHHVDLPCHMQHTDNLFVQNILPHISTVKFEDYILYNYMLGRDGQSVNINYLSKHHEQLLEVLRLAFSAYEQSAFRGNPHLLYKLKTTYYIFLSHILKLYKVCDLDVKSVIKELDTYVAEKIPELYSASQEHKKLRLLRVSNYFFVPLVSYIEKHK